MVTRIRKSNVRFLESREFEVGRVLSIKTEEDPEHSCDLREAVIGHEQMFDKTPGIVDDSYRIRCSRTLNQRPI
jgi:hypothetical protein